MTDFSTRWELDKAAKYSRRARTSPVERSLSEEPAFARTHHVSVSPSSLAKYLNATRHPLPSLIFLLPLLIGYEVGVFILSGHGAPSLRNGADAWLRLGVERLGIDQLFVVPALVVGLLLVGSLWRWRERPRNILGVCLGMAIESVVFALGLWAISRNFAVLLDRFGIELTISANWSQIVTYLGAGIYEEVLFRLLLMGAILVVLRFLVIPNLFAVPIAIVTSSLLFAGAHHIGPHGEAMDSYVFLFRAAAGAYFAMLYWFRGFGIAVGAHVGYDVMVGVEWG